MNVLITGATGFVGSNLAAALAARGDRVRVLRRAGSRMDALEGIPVEEIVGNILDPGSVPAAMEGCDLVFHAAGLSHYGRTLRNIVYDVNVQGTRNVMQAALHARVPRVVHTSSIAALGFPPRGQVADESQGFPDELRWWAYGHSKHLAEEEVRKMVAQGLSAVIVNPAIVFGPRDVNFISGVLLRASVRGHLRFVPPGGSSVVHVGDAVAGHLAAAARGRTGERYILAGENLTHREIARIVAEVTGGPGPLAVLPHWSLPPLAWVMDTLNVTRRRPPVITGEHIRLGGETFYVDNRKAVRQLGLPQTPFRQAVQDAYAWYRLRHVL